MKKVLLCCVLSLLGYITVEAQQNLFSNLNYHLVTINPAYTGAKESLNLTASHSNRWLNLDGSPNTQILSGHANIKSDWGIGGSVLRNRIGSFKNQKINAYLAYHRAIGKEGKLSLGATVSNHHYNYFGGTSIPSTTNISFFNIGLGVFYQRKQFYVGASVPDLITEFQTSTGVLSRPSKYYVMTGGEIPLFPKWTLRPSVLFFNNYGYPTNNILSAVEVVLPSLDIDMAVAYNNKILIGTTFKNRFGGLTVLDVLNEVQLWSAYQLSKHLRISASLGSYLSRLRMNNNANSFQITLGYGRT